MSIYGPRIRLPRLRLPRFDMPKISIGSPKKMLLVLLVVVIIILGALALMSVQIDFGGPLSVSWKDNPLQLTQNNLTKTAELQITLRNLSEQKKDITLSVTTESGEIIIACPDQFFPNVEPKDYRVTKCIIRRNPNQKVYSGSYTLTINSNVGQTKTVLQIVTG